MKLHDEENHVSISGYAYLIPTLVGIPFSLIFLPFVGKLIDSVLLKESEIGFYDGLTAGILLSLVLLIRLLWLLRRVKTQERERRDMVERLKRKQRAEEVNVHDGIQ